VDGAQGSDTEPVLGGGGEDEDQKLKMLLRALMRSNGISKEEIERLLGSSESSNSAAAEYMRDSFTGAGRSTAGGGRAAGAAGARGR
jgi:hypothetical protein